MAIAIVIVIAIVIAIAIAIAIVIRRWVRGVFRLAKLLPKWRSIDVGPQTDIALRRRFRALAAATGGWSSNANQEVEQLSSTPEIG